uniref:Secreted protein n=1 Tax=Anopheles culicifacies TaxID=139723 RepID=A0A182MV09_9DIPT
MKLVAGIAFTFLVALLVANVSITSGSPLPGMGGIPDFANMGHGFGAKISNIIKGNTYDGLERAMRKLSQYQQNPSPQSTVDSDGDSDESAVFGFSGKQFEQLLAMLEQSKQPAQHDAVPFATIDNSVD